MLLSTNFIIKKTKISLIQHDLNVRYLKIGITCSFFRIHCKGNPLIMKYYYKWNEKYFFLILKKSLKWITYNPRISVIIAGYFTVNSSRKCMCDDASLIGAFLKRKIKSWKLYADKITNHHKILILNLHVIIFERQFRQPQEKEIFLLNKRKYYFLEQTWVHFYN